MTFRNEDAFRAGHAKWAAAIKARRTADLELWLTALLNGTIRRRDLIAALDHREQRAYQRGWANRGLAAKKGVA